MENRDKMLRGGGILIFLFHIIYSNAPLYKESMSKGPSAQQFNYLLGKVIEDLSGWNISLFVLFLIVFYFLVYLHPWKEGEYREFIYIIVVPFLLYYAFSEYNFYRSIYIMPFLYILFMLNHEKIIFNLLFEIIVNMGLAVKFYCEHMTFFSNYSVFQFVRNIYSKIGGTPWLDGIRQAREDIAAKGNPMITMILTVVFAALLLLVIINSPRCRWSLENHTGMKEKQLLWLRALIPLGLILLSFYGK